MAEQSLLLGRSTTTVVENTSRRVVALPGGPSKDFILNAKCRIVSVGGRIGISAADLPGESGGTYTWSTTSSKIRLANTTGPTLAVEALMTPGTARDSETITVTRTGNDGAKTSKTVTVTVAKVTFSRAENQLYGYDDFDTPLNHDDDHISLKSQGQTSVAVRIEGGALGTDFDFVCDDVEICSAESAPEKPEFNLRLNAKKWQKATTVLRAKNKCPAGAVFASITVHVYAEKVVKVVVAKVADSNSAVTALRFGSADYASHQSRTNEKLREAVVRYEVRNFNASNSVLDVHYDKNKSGVLHFDINSQGGTEFELIKRAVSANPDEQRVVIVREMKSFYYLERAAKKGEREIAVRGSNVYTASMDLGSGSSKETVDVASNTGNVAHLVAPLKFDHLEGETLEFPAAAWSSNPIIIMEGAVSLDELSWTLMHEVAHIALQLEDVSDPANVMNVDQTNTDYRLRFCPRESNYSPGRKENQWEKIPRPRP